MNFPSGWGALPRKLTFPPKNDWLKDVVSKMMDFFVGISFLNAYSISSWLIGGLGWCFGILAVPLSNKSFYKGTP